jgi:hypothetical protein
VLSIDAARWLLVAHAVLAFAAVAACTHWCVYLYPFARGRFVRVRAAKRFGVIAMSLYLVTAIGGLVLYPTYKANVKLEYLTSSRAVLDDRAARARASEEVTARSEGRPARALDPGAVLKATGHEAERAEKVARWFDVKEHWVAVGALLGLAAMAMLLAWDPKRDGTGPLAFVLLGAAGTTATVWLAAIVGLVTAATRSF